VFFRGYFSVDLKTHLKDSFFPSRSVEGCQVTITLENHLVLLGSEFHFLGWQYCSKSTVNQATAKATLTQIINIVYKRFELDVEVRFFLIFAA
jgi:hypothetical protein